MDASAAPSDAARAAILSALLPIAARDGFTPQSIAAAAAAAGVSPGMAELAAPRGAVDMLDAFADWADQGMKANLSEVDLLSLKIRERVRTAVLARLDALERVKPTARRAAQALAVPGRAQEAVAHLWRTADRTWRLIGDQSTDGNFYSKRAILSGVIGATMARWLAEPEGRAATEAFLDKRIENVMQFEKLKAQAKPLGLAADLAMARLARWRYGADGERT
jgi:ubiquinone biosynthesis protein COQ9